MEHDLVVDCRIILQRAQTLKIHPDIPSNVTAREKGRMTFKLDEFFSTKLLHRGSSGTKVVVVMLVVLCNMLYWMSKEGVLLVLSVLCDDLKYGIQDQVY